MAITSRRRPDPAPPPEPEPAPGTDPVSIRRALSARITGQAEQVQRISVLLSLHLRRPPATLATQVAPNAVVVGPTGCGKTHTFRVAADLLDIPFVAVDTTALVPSGVVGLQIEDVLGDLVASAEHLLQRRGGPRRPGDALALAERGILFFDEFDKVRATVGDGAGAAQNVQNRQVQRRLLKICEGAAVPVAVRNHEGGQATPAGVRTRGILVVAAGSFAGIGGTDELAHGQPVGSADLVRFGIAPELVARLPIVVRYDPLSVDDLVAILRNEQVSPLTMWRDYLAGAGATLTVTDGAALAIATRAHGLRLGARGLQQVSFPVLAGLVERAFTGDLAGELRVTAEDVTAVDLTAVDARPAPPSREFVGS